MPLNKPVFFPRSVLFAPAENARMIEKILSSPHALGADVVIFDLEDAVSPDQKDEARQLLCKKLRQRPKHTHCLIRINELNTSWSTDDIKACVDIQPDGIVLPKVNEVDDIHHLNAILDVHHAAETLHLWAMIETPAAILNIANIAASAKRPGNRLTTLVLGTNDLSLATGTVLKPGRAAYLPWIMQCLAAARAYDLVMLDGVYNAYKDPAGFAQECAEAASWGFDGKSLIHPSQIAPCNAAFMPDKQAITEAKAICAAFADPQNASQGVLSVNGKMVEELHLKQAQKVLKRADWEKNTFS